MKRTYDPSPSTAYFAVVNMSTTILALPTDRVNLKDEYNVEDLMRNSTHCIRGEMVKRLTSSKLLRDPAAPQKATSSCGEVQHLSFPAAVSRDANIAHIYFYNPDEQQPTYIPRRHMVGRYCNQQDRGSGRAHAAS